MAKILVVEGNQDYQELLQNFLENAHHEIMAAADGAAALAMIDSKFCDLILLDLMLPGMDGFNVRRAIRQKCDTPVIMLTALDSESHQMRGYELQNDDYITQPVSIALLLHKVEAVLRRTMPSVSLSTSETLNYEGISLDLRTHTAVNITGNSGQRKITICSCGRRAPCSEAVMHCTASPHGLRWYWRRIRQVTRTREPVRQRFLSTR